MLASRRINFIANTPLKNAAINPRNNAAPSAVPAAFAGYLIGSMASSWRWSTAGIIQISVFSVIGAILGAFLKPHQFSRPGTAGQLPGPVVRDTQNLPGH